jgi:RHS repeat-associated protein
MTTACKNKYFPYGGLRNSTGSIPTDKRFTGQRLDSTGLYYYNARYYDPEIGRFISPDYITIDFTHSQDLNRYSYVTNNPLKYTDSLGLFEEEELSSIGISRDNVSSDTWGILRDANVGDSVNIGGQTQYFYHQIQNEGDERGVLSMLNTEGSFSSVGGTMGGAELLKSGGSFSWFSASQKMDSRDGQCNTEHAYSLIQIPGFGFDVNSIPWGKIKGGPEMIGGGMDFAIGVGQCVGAVWYLRGSGGDIINTAYLGKEGVKNMLTGAGLFIDGVRSYTNGKTNPSNILPRGIRLPW